MAELDNKTIMCSVFFLDIVGYSKKSVTGQISLKDRFNIYLSAAIRDVPITDRIILDTGDGAAINFLGDVEDALKAALSLRESLLNEDPNLNHPLLVRMGINLGPVRLVRDINGQPNIVGDGINVAQRVMGFADASQVLVSRSYFDAVSRLSPQYAGMFHYQGSRTDKHVREHEVYAIGYPDEKTNPKLNKKSKKALARAMDATRTTLRPFMFLHANLLQGFLRAGPVKRVLFMLVLILGMLAVLEVTEEKLLGGATQETPLPPVSSSPKIIKTPQMNAAIAPSSAPIVVAESKPTDNPPAVAAVESPVKKEIVTKKKIKETPPFLEAEHKITGSTEATNNTSASDNAAKESPVETGMAASDSKTSVEEAPVGNQGTNLSVTCVEGTEVFIDGARKGKLEGSSLIVPVAPGRHLVIVSNAKGMDWKFIKFKAGTTVSENPDFCNH